MPWDARKARHALHVGKAQELEQKPNRNVTVQPSKRPKPMRQLSPNLLTVTFTNSVYVIRETI